MTTDDPIAAKRRAREERKAAHLRATMERHAGRLRVLAERDAVAVANRVHGDTDALIARDRDRDPESAAIRCGRGCSACCRNPVEIWPQEAALLAQAARAAGIELDRARLERQARQSAASWHEQSEADRACVFLGADGACRVYDARPNACRKLLVVSDPALCDPARHAPEETQRWHSWEAELLEVAALETFGRGLMPASLLAALNGQEGATG
jgi:Fe-S-cluster containining protein